MLSNPSRSFGRLRDRYDTARLKTLVRLGGRLAPFYLVNEFPKSGGTWLTQMLAEALDIPFRRNELVRFERSMVHGHFLNPAMLTNTVLLWRDPRDLIVSLYHHCYFVSEFRDRKFGNKNIVSLMKDLCPFADYEDVRGNLPEFIRFISTQPIAPRYTWPQFVDAWAGRRVAVETSYEALRADTPVELGRIVQALTGQAVAPARLAEIAERHSFGRAKRKAEESLPPGAEKSFVREGSVGGWRRHFSDEALRELETRGYNAAMRKLGYQA